LTESPNDQILSRLVLLYFKLSPLENENLLHSWLAGSLVAANVDKKMLLRMLNSEPATEKTR
jgi:hypothetical protein